MRLLRFMERKRQTYCSGALIAWWTAALLTDKSDSADDENFEDGPNALETCLDLCRRTGERVADAECDVQGDCVRMLREQEYILSKLLHAGFTLSSAQAVCSKTDDAAKGLRWQVLETSGDQEQNGGTDVNTVDKDESAPWELTEDADKKMEVLIEHAAAKACNDEHTRALITAGDKLNTLKLQVASLQKDLLAANDRADRAEAECGQLALNECAHLEQLAAARREQSTAANSAAQAAAAAAQQRMHLLEKITTLEEENGIISQRAMMARSGDGDVAAALQRRIRASEEAALESEKRLRAACQATEEVESLLRSEEQQRKDAEAEVLAIRDRILALKRERLQEREIQWEKARERETQREAEREEDMRELEKDKASLRESLDRSEKELKQLREDKSWKNASATEPPRHMVEASQDITELVMLISRNDRAAETAFLHEILVWLLFPVQDM